MTSKKVYFGIIGLLIFLGMGILLSAHEANTLLEKQSSTLITLKAKNQALSLDQKQLIQDNEDIAKYADLNTIAQSVVPQDKDQAEAVREIVNLAAQSGITQLSSITFPASTLGNGTTIKTSGGLTQVTPVDGIPGVFDLQITITQANTSEVPYNDFTTFLARLEQNRRTAEVSSITVQPDQKQPNMISFTLVIDEFIRP
jgi:hypothetical protein